MSTTDYESTSRQRKAFEQYLRTGRGLADQRHMAEGIKFNPWHDPRDGRFTFAPGGPKSGFSGMRQPASEPVTIHPPRLEPRRPSSDEPIRSNRGHHIIVPIREGKGTYEEYAAAKIKAGAKRIWPVPIDGRPAKRGEIGPNGKPYSDGRFSITGDFRRYPNGTPKPHHGIDLPAAVGTPVLAAADGVVEAKKWADGYGTIVLVRHNDGTRAMYAHLSERSVTTGQRIKIGQQLGRVGMSGNGADRGSHLHFEISDAGLSAFLPRAKLNPTTWMIGGQKR